MVFATLKDVPGFITFNLPCFPQDLRVPCFAQANALRKRCGRNRRRSTPLRRPAFRQAMYAFDVTASLDSETRHARAGPQTGHLFIQRHQRKDVLDSLFNGQVRILKRVLIPGWFLGSLLIYSSCRDDTTELEN